MLGKPRMTFESPNAIDAGEAPPSRPGRRPGGNGGRRSPRSVRVQERLVSDERLFRGTRIKIESSDSSGDDGSSSSSSSSGDEENPSPRARAGRRRYSTNSYNDADELEVYEGDEGSVAQLPSPNEARLYAAAVLTESFRRDSDDSDEEALAALSGSFQEEEEEVRPLSKSSAPLNTWRRPSRRKQNSGVVQIGASEAAPTGEARRSALYLCTTIGCSIVLMVTAVAFVVVVSLAAAKKGGGSTETTGVNNMIGNAGDLTSPRYLKTIDWLELHGISDRASLTTTGTPQFRAAVWMAELDVLQEDIPVTVASDDTTNTNMHDTTAQHTIDAFNTTIGASTTQQEAHHRHVIYERFLQRYVLAVLYYATNGDDWTHDLEFLSPSHECGWFRGEKGSDNHEYAVGVTCNDKLLVRDLFMVSAGLSGTIPTELQFLQHLELLSLRRNSIGGSIPTELSNLKGSLLYLDLSKNAFTGEALPPSIGSLKNLKALGLANNQFQGTLPSELSQLVSLITLDLENNTFTGSVNTILGDLDKLEYLYLGANEFDDVLDDTFLAALSKLKELKLNANLFKSNSELPVHLLSHPHLTLLDMSSNLLQASFSSTVTSTTSSPLKFLSLHSNQMRGSIPLMIQSLSSLSYIDLSRNAFEGTIPVSLGNMKSLTHISLGFNNFAPGPIPPTLFTISNLRELSLPGAHLTGAIPQWVSLLSDLEHVDLRENSLTGAIPDSVWGMPALNTLVLSANLLESSLPHTFPQSQLEILALENNAITGNAVGICESAPHLTTFAYGCDQIICTGPCCHLECCGAGGGDTDNTVQCFTALLSASLQVKDDEEVHAYQANRTFYSFSPSIILHDSV